MFRLRYSTGEEAIFRSVEELALGLRSGIIGTDTFVLDNAAHVWQPLVQHPLYGEATALAATLNSYGELELEPAFGAPRPSSGEFRSPIAPPKAVYQMASISGSELQARRNQKRLMKAGIFAGAALVVATSGFMIWKERHHAEATDLVQAPVAAAPVTRRTGGSSPTTTAYWLSPGILAARREAAQIRIDQALTDSSTRMGLEDLTRLSRLRSEDSLRAGVDLIRRWRNLSEAYRAASFGMLKVYQDSANLQLRSDQWSLLDANDWKSRSAFVEGPLDALRTDSLLGGLQKLYELLLAQKGDYTLELAMAEFPNHRARVEYQRLSGIIQRHGPTNTNARDRVSLPLALLRHGLEGPGLPVLPPDPADR